MGDELKKAQFDAKLSATVLNLGKMTVLSLFCGRAKSQASPAYTHLKSRPCGTDNSLSYSPVSDIFSFHRSSLGRVGPLVTAASQVLRGSVIWGEVSRA